MPSSEFYNFDPTASQVRAGANVDAPPVETHQKITVNGQSFAYTAHAGFLPLLNATTGAPEAHVFFTSYVKDGVSELPAVRIMFFFGGAPGVSAAWQEFRRSRSEADEIGRRLGRQSRHDPEPERTWYS